jgi:hypothetical protein
LLIVHKRCSQLRWLIQMEFIIRDLWLMRTAINGHRIGTGLFSLVSLWITGSSSAVRANCGKRFRSRWDAVHIWIDPTLFLLPEAMEIRHG